MASVFLKPGVEQAIQHKLWLTVKPLLEVLLGL